MKQPIPKSGVPHPAFWQNLQPSSRDIHNIPTDSYVALRDFPLFRPPAINKKDSASTLPAGRMARSNGLIVGESALCTVPRQCGDGNRAISRRRTKASLNRATRSAEVSACRSDFASSSGDVWERGSAVSLCSAPDPGWRGISAENRRSAGDFRSGLRSARRITVPIVLLFLFVRLLNPTYRCHALKCVIL